MNYFARHIGDYYKKAGKLSMLQHGAYTLLMDACYDREDFPTKEEAIDWTWASTTEEVEAVEFILKKFFKFRDGVYIQKRISETLQEYSGLCQTNKINGEKGGRPIGSKNKPKKTHPVNLKTHPVNLKTEANPNGSKINPKPITNNHKPITNNQEKKEKPKSLDEARSYFVEQGSTSSESETFYDHFESNGWKVGGKTAMKDWKAAARNWIKRNINNKPNQHVYTSPENVDGDF